MSRINTNIPSLQAIHRLSANQSDLSIRLERLSTGLRINRGEDDPAGLIASEGLRSEIAGIGQAVVNSQRAINVMSTAEGALNEISSMLVDMRALINDAANQGANSSSEVQADQLQVDSLLEAIDRIASTTQFGGEKLINGNYGYTVSGLAASAIATATIFGARVPAGGTTNVTVQVTTSALTAEAVFAGDAVHENVTIEVKGNLGSEIVALTDGSSAIRIMSAINAVTHATGVVATVSGTGLNTRILLNSQTYGHDAIVGVTPINGTFIVAPGSSTLVRGQEATVLINGQSAAVNGLSASLRANGLDVQIDMTAERATNLGTSNFYITGGGATFQIGPEVNANGQVSIGIPSVSTSNLGNATVGFLNTIRGAGTNSLIRNNSGTAEQIVVEAINQVAVIRGRLGGLQRNQIETNINSQNVALENVKAAESAIRDASVATEVAALTRAQILVQSTTSILGVANQMPQQALALLSRL